MKISFPIEISDDITGTLTVSMKIGKEMYAHMLRKQIDPEEIDNIAFDKLQEIAREVAAFLEIPFDEDT